MSVTVSIKVRKEVVEIADKMVKYGLARSRSHAFNIMIERGLREVLEEVRLWERIHREVEEYERRGLKLSLGCLSKLLEEERGAR